MSYELECYSCGAVGEIGDEFRLVSWGRQCCECGSYEVHATVTTLREFAVGGDA